jgi:dTDP-4-dehydrorhamnose 3,5-epimerase
MIEGVIIKKLKKIPDERGTIFKMLQATDEEFKGFGEIYFSTVYPGVVKGWHLHEEAYLNYAVIKGMIKLVLFDGRPGSPTEGEIQEIYLGKHNYCLVQIPPNVWNAFKGIGTEEAIVANVNTLPHEQDKMKRLDPHSNDLINYDWSSRPDG